MADILSNALSSLVSHQRALATTSHNIANVDTQGYSRQQVSFASRNNQQVGSLGTGAGVDVAQIRRMYDQFAVSQLRTASSAVGQFDAQYQLASELDNSFADSQTGLSASLSQFFNSLQDVANEPSSIPARQLLLAEAQTLSSRFVDLSAKIDSVEAEIAGRVESEIAGVNDLANQIAEINKLISGAVGGADSNDLLDKRDQAILELNQLLNVSTTIQDDGSVNVFVGRGEALVLGSETNALTTIPNTADPNRVDVVFADNTGATITDFIFGGSIGGALSFQRETLDVARNELGRIAVAVADALNQQNNAGLDLYGQRGNDIFELGAPRTAASVNNTGVGSVTASIVDIGALSAEDLTLRFNGAGWSVTSQQTGQAVSGLAGSGTAADPFLINGVAIAISGNVNAGDEFYVKPTADAAGGMKVVMVDPSRIAAAAATRSTAGAANTGEATISDTRIVDANNAGLTDSVEIQFLDASSYQINGAGSFAYTSGQPIIVNGNEFTIRGIPNAGDSFTVSANTGGSGDNRNVLAMATIEDVKALLGGSVSINDAVSGMVGKIAVYTRSTEVNLQAQQNLKSLAEERQAGVSGVNLDEEAANLMRYQQAYSAAAQAISTANDMFQTLIGAFR